MPVVVFPFIYFLKCISGLSPAMGRRLHLKNSKFPVINSEKRRNSISFAREENKIIHCSWSHGWGPGLRMRRFGFYFCLSLIEGESTNCSGWETQLMEFSRRDLDPIWNLQPFNNKTSSFFFSEGPWAFPPFLSNILQFLHKKHFGSDCAKLFLQAPHAAPVGILLPLSIICPSWAGTSIFGHWSINYMISFF